MLISPFNGVRRAKLNILIMEINNAQEQTSLCSIQAKCPGLDEQCPGCGKTMNVAWQKVICTRDLAGVRRLSYRVKSSALLPRIGSSQHACAGFV
jgi:hypothetical protein